MIEVIRGGFEFVSMLYPFYRKDAIKILTDTHSIDEYYECIKKNRIEKAEIIMPNLDILKLCPSLKYLKIFPSFNSQPNFDYSILYEMPEIKFLNCHNIYGNRRQYISKIDYSQIQGLTNVVIDVNKCTLNYNKIKSLKSMVVGNYTNKFGDLNNLFCSSELDTLRLIDCNIYSLDGIDISNKMQCLYIYRNRLLTDVNALNKVKGTLKTLRIENCPKIEDFSVLSELENLELLELSGSNTLPSLDFLKSMKNLKTFIFNMNVLDGDLSPCLDLSYVYSEKNRKHYNLKDKDLPKGLYVRGNEDIEEWRRLE